MSMRRSHVSPASILLSLRETMTPPMVFNALPRPLCRYESIILLAADTCLLTELSNVVAYPCRHSLKRFDRWPPRDNPRATSPNTTNSPTTIACSAPPTRCWAISSASPAAPSTTGSPPTPNHRLDPQLIGMTNDQPSVPGFAVPPKGCTPG